MRYKVWIKPQKKDILGSMASGGIDSYGNEVANNVAIRSKFISVDENIVYAVIVRDGMTIEIHEYDSAKTHLSTSSTPIVRFAYRDGADVNKQIRSYYLSPTSSAVKYWRIVLHGYNGGYNVNLNPRVTQLQILEPSKPILIHDSAHPDPFRHLKDPVLSLSDNSSGSLTFSIYPGHMYYDADIKLFVDTLYVIRVYDNGSERIIWDGRPISIDLGFDKVKNICCEGAMGYFNDIRIKYSTRAYNKTIYEFISDNIVETQNMVTCNNVRGKWSDGSSDGFISGDRQDRSIFSDDLPELGNHNVSTVVPESTPIVYINRGEQYSWNPNYEGGFQWLKDYIVGAFGGHIKILYPPNNDISRDYIRRTLCIIQKFDFKETILQWSASGVYSEGSLTFNNNLVWRRTAIDTQYNYEPGTSGTGIYWVNVDNLDITIFPQKYSIEKFSDHATWKPFDYRIPEAYIDFGENLLDYAKTDSINNFATRIIPRGQSIEDVTDRSLDYYVYLDGNSSPSSYLSGDIVYHTGQSFIDDIYLQNKYGVIEACVDFEDAATPTQLLKNAVEWFKDLRKSIIDTTINVSVSDLGNSVVNGTRSNFPMADPYYFDLWTKVYVTAKPFGLNKELYYVTSIEIHLDDPSGTNVTLTSKNHLLTDSSITNGMISGTKKGVIDKN